MAYTFFVPEETRDLLLLADLAKELDVSHQAVRCWARDGMRGAKLRVCQLSKGLGTSRQEYDRFVQEMTEIVKDKGTD